MRAVAEQTHTVDTARLAVLAALNIADEYHLVKRNQDAGSGDYLRRAQHRPRLDEQSTQLDPEAMAAPRAAVLALWRAVFG